MDLHALTRWQKPAGRRRLVSFLLGNQVANEGLAVVAVEVVAAFAEGESVALTAAGAGDGDGEGLVLEGGRLAPLHAHEAESCAPRRRRGKRDGKRIGLRGQ